MEEKQLEFRLNFLRGLWEGKADMFKEMAESETSELGQEYKSGAAWAYLEAVKDLVRVFDETL